MRASDGELGNGNGFGMDRELVKWGVFGKWMGMGGKFKRGGLRGGWWLICWITRCEWLREQWVFIGNIPVLKDGI